MAATCLLTACGTAYDSVWDTTKLAVLGPPSVTMSKDQVAQLRYASLYARVGEGGYAVLVLGEASDSLRKWYSADQRMLATDHGRLVRTLNFEHDLTHIEWLSADPVATGLQHVSADTVARRRIDWMPGYHSGLLVESRFRNQGLTHITIADTDHPVLHILEDIHIAQLDYQGQNEFWVDPASGFVWQSRQMIVPGGPMVEAQVLKPYRGDQ